MSRKLGDLCPRFRPLAESVIARCVEAGQMVMIVDTLRTQVEQAEYLRRGVSQTMNSLHLPQTRCGVCCEIRNSDGTLGLSHAIDLAPYEEWSRKGPDKLSWDSAHPGWQIIGQAARSVGLTWGGDWRTFKDLAHVQDSVGVGKAARLVQPQEDK